MQRRYEEKIMNIENGVSLYVLGRKLGGGGGEGVTYIQRRIMQGKYCIIENGVLLCWCGEGFGWG